MSWQEAPTLNFSLCPTSWVHPWVHGRPICLAKGGDRLIVLFGGGTKRGQQRDIDRAKALHAEGKAGPRGSVERDPAFANALLDEAATLFLNGEAETARLILRDLVNATLGFEQLAEATGKPSKSLHRRLSPKGNPSMDNLAAIFGAVRQRLGVGLEVHTVQAHA
ncbi:MAG: hypothetical protein NVSMB34_10420 [Variovorax sp.]